MNINLQIKPVILAYILGLGMLVMHGVANADHIEIEKCYGVAKAGQNDCGSSSTACDKSVIDGDPNYWIYVPTGICNKLVGGMTTAGGGQSGVTTMPLTPPVAAPSSTATTPAMPVMPEPSLSPSATPAPGAPTGVTNGGTGTGASSVGY